MQINERVWRGFYDTHKLRWDISYNARAGAEVLLQYLVKYALKRGEHKHPGGLDNLARSAYSAYNGGPGQTSRYRNSKASTAHKKIDAAFWKKYQAVKQGNELKVAQCLGGDTTSMAAVSAKRPLPKKVSNRKTEQPSAISPNSVGKSWILAQNKTHYTLQLAVFSAFETARKFTADLSLQDNVAIIPLGKPKQG